MSLRGCSSSHFIWSIEDGGVKKVHNMDSHGRPSLKFKKLDEIYQPANSECIPLSLAERDTSERVKENEPDKENSLEELTLSQFRKKLKGKKRKASQPVLLTPKAEDDDFDLTEPLCRFRVKGSKSSQSKRVSANGNSPTSSKGAQLAPSEISKHFATVHIKVEALEQEYFESNYDMKRGKLESFTNEGERCEFNEVSGVEYTESNHDPKRGESELFTTEVEKCESNVAPEVEHFESSRDLKRGEMESFTNEGEKCEFNKVIGVEYIEGNHDLKRGESESFTNAVEKCEFNEAPEVEYFASNHDLKRGELESFTNEGENCEFNEVPEVEHSESSHAPKREESESFTNEGEKYEFNEVLFDSVDDIKNMEIDDEETIANVNQPPSVPSSLANDSFVKVSTANASDCCQSQLHIQQIPEQVDYISAAQSSDPTIDDESGEYVASMETKSPISENKSPTSMNIDADSNSFNSDDISLISKDVFILQEVVSTIPANTGSEVKLGRNDQTSVMIEAPEIRQPERLPLTRKSISPNSQEKLCQAMNYAEPLDDMDHFKCKEKLYFGEQAENKFSSTSDAEDNEQNVHSQQATQFIQNKAVISSKHVLKRARNCKKVSPTNRGIAPKGSLDGPRLCRSLPRLSTGCTSIEGCSESAIAFSERQMHDIESLASKLLSELNSMKVIVEEKLLYEAYRSPSLKNEADEVKSAIKSVTKTEETAKKWLSMMARDCNRFCKIMKLNEDHNTSASGDPALVSINQDKPLEREKKKISFADEAGGTLCDIKVYQIEQEPSIE